MSVCQPVNQGVDCRLKLVGGGGDLSAGVVHGKVAVLRRGFANVVVHQVRFTAVFWPQVTVVGRHTGQNGVLVVLGGQYELGRLVVDVENVDGDFGEGAQAVGRGVLSSAECLDQQQVHLTGFIVEGALYL